ncbi:hypothetical protein RhiirA4_540731 [Rhizophagus irregularis]|uniref:Uncharacterized protein n=1 Tax=Rhizophagus irregularis TaxID=588596 RepID=A0A2I1G8F6_9GLOM|nr:hypothetical protein RhiirA4_540731 [Rhizophagus irregularis]
MQFLGFVKFRLQVLASNIWSLLGLASDTWSLLVHGLWMGLRFRIIDFGYWYQFMGSNRYQLRFLGFGFGSWTLDRFQLPIVFGIQGSELSEVY